MAVVELTSDASLSPEAWADEVRDWWELMAGRPAADGELTPSGDANTCMLRAPEDADEAMSTFLTWGLPNLRYARLTVGTGAESQQYLISGAELATIENHPATQTNVSDLDGDDELLDIVELPE